MKALANEDSSRPKAAVAAAQGMYRSVKVKNDNTEAREENSVRSAVSNGTEVSAKIFKELITASFAESPVISAVTAFQLANPSGANSGASTFPTAARMLSELSATSVKEKPKLCKTKE